MYKITSVKHCLDFCVVTPAHEYYFYLVQKLLCAFRTVRGILNPSDIEAVTNGCERFWKFFHVKIAHIRSIFSLSFPDTSLSSPMVRNTLEGLHMVSVARLGEIVNHMKPSVSFVV